MSASSSTPTRTSLGRVLRVLPLGPLQPPLAFAAWLVGRKAALSDRLGPHAAKRFGLEVVELPFAFLLEPGEARLRAVRELPVALDVHIRGSLAGYLSLLAGIDDGDALFFSRQLIIEGDMEAALALRNGIDAAEIVPMRQVLKRLVESIGRWGEPTPHARREHPGWS